MKYFIVFLFFSFLLASCSDKETSPTNSSNSEDYTTGGDILPLKIGNSWNYYQDVEGIEVKYSITNDDVYYKWDGVEDSARLYGESWKADGSSSEDIFGLNQKHLAKTSTGVAVGKWNNSASKIVTIYFLPNQPVVGTDNFGNSWTKVESVVTKKGTFKYCWKVQFQNMLDGYMIFKKGIGLVYSNNFSRNYNLKSYIFN